MKGNWEETDEFQIWESGKSGLCFKRVTLTNKQTHRKRDQICGYQRLGSEEGELDEGSQKIQSSSYMINQY